MNAQTDEQVEAVAPTQDDRDMAARIAAFSGATSGEVARIQGGQEDASLIVQALAHHRPAAMPAAHEPAAEVARLREAVEKERTAWAIFASQKTDHHRNYLNGYKRETDAILAALEHRPCQQWSDAAGVKDRLTTDDGAEAPASDGLVCVPREPTEAMLERGMARAGFRLRATMRAVWSAMLTAATQEPNQ